MAVVDRDRMTRITRQFIKFGLVGGSGVLVNMVVAFVMTQLNGGVSNYNRVVVDLPGPFEFRFTVLVWIVAFLVANLWNFQLNRSWTFKRIETRSWWSEFWAFFIIGAVAAFLGIFIKIALTNAASPIYLPDPPFNDVQGFRAREYWSQLITIIVTMPINFVVNKLWTFRAIQPNAEVSDADLTDAAAGVSTCT